MIQNSISAWSWTYADHCKEDKAGLDDYEIFETSVLMRLSTLLRMILIQSEADQDHFFSVMEVELGSNLV